MFAVLSHSLWDGLQWSRRLSGAGQRRRRARWAFARSGDGGAYTADNFVDDLEASGSWHAFYVMDSAYLTLSGSDITAAENVTNPGTYDLTGSGFPQYNSTGMGSESRPYAAFDGVDNSLGSTSMPEVNGTYPSLTAYGALQDLAPGGYEVALSRVWTYFAVNATGGFESYWDGGQAPYTDAGWSSTGEHAFVIRCASTGNHDIRIDGTANSYGSGGTCSDFGTHLQMGAFGATPSLFAPANWGFAGVPSGSMSATFATDVESAMETYFNG